MSIALITIVIPSYNQGRYLEKALQSVFEQDLPIEVFVMDGGSTDNSIEIINKWSTKLAGWRSHSDAGQAAAINEGIAKGTASYVCWLNSDDWFLPGGLAILLSAIQQHTTCPAVYGRSWNVEEKTGKYRPVWVQSFSEKRLALRCIISQPATLIRRTAWEEVGGLNEKLHMAMDYDLWWHLYKNKGDLHFVDEFVAVNRNHKETKTSNYRHQHYQEAMAVVFKYYGKVPLKWWLLQPYAVWFKWLKSKYKR